MRAQDQRGALLQQAIGELFRGRPRYDVNLLYVLWQPDIDGIREDPRFREALDEMLDYAGLPGATLRRAPPEG